MTQSVYQKQKFNRWTKVEIIQKLRQQERKEHKYEKQQAPISRLKPFEHTVGKTREWHL